MGLPIYVVIRATRRFTRLRGKGSTFTSQLSVKTLSIRPAPGIEPATSPSAIERSNDWANHAYLTKSLSISNMNVIN